MFHYVFGSGWSSSEAELSFVGSWDGMMVSWPAIIMSIVRLSLMSMVVVSVRNLGWDPAAPAPRVWSFSLSTCVASRAVCSLKWGGRQTGRGRRRKNTLKLKCKTVNKKSDHESKLWNVQNAKFINKPCMFTLFFMHADLTKFAISRILHAPTQNDESFPTIWCWNIWTKIVNIYSPPPPSTHHRRQEWMTFKCGHRENI